MHPFTATRPPRLALRIALSSAIVVALVGVLAVGATAKGSKQVVKQTANTTLSKTVLTNLKGRTLYTLSAETNGKFICTGGCLSAWHPLTVKAGVKPTGPVKLGTVARPEGGLQVTYRGRPLYAFSGDSSNGEVNGEGIKDVGTWHAATSSKPVPPPAPPTPEPPPYPY